MQKICKQCGTTNEEHARFCGKCGLPLETDAGKPAHEKMPAKQVAESRGKIDLKLVEWIKTNQTRYSRSQIIEMLKKEGHAEQDISDSYDEVVKRSGNPMAFVTGGVKSMAVTAILSFFVPGAGHMYTGAVGKGVLILVLYGFGFFLTITLLGAIVGIPLMLAMWLWGLIGSILRCDKINKGLLQS